MSTRARLYALRRLPRSTAVGIVPIEEEQRLAEELLALPDPVDPVAWLRDQRTPEIARHTLRAALRSYRVINRGPAPLFSGAGLDLDSGAGLDGEALIRALRQVQAKPRWTLRLSIPGAFIDDIHELFAELLLIHDPINPLLWLEEEPQATLAAALTLRDLVGYLHPPAAWGDLSRFINGDHAMLANVGPMEIMRHLRPAVTVRSSLGVAVTRAEVVLRRAAFSADACIELTPPASPARGQRPLTTITGFWDGFTQVEDDLGQRYLPTRVEPWHGGYCGPASGPVGSRLSIGARVYYYPAVDPTARALTFNSPASTVWLLGHCVPLDDIPLPPCVIGDISWGLELRS